MEKPDVIESLLDKYSENLPMRLVVNYLLILKFPFAPMVDMMATDIANQMYKRRLEVFLNELKNQVNKIEENNLNKEYLKSEEFFDIFNKATQKSVQERFDEKIKAYAKIVVGAIEGVLSGSGTNYSKAEIFIDIVTSLSPEDLLVAKISLDNSIKNFENHKVAFIDSTDVAKEINLDSSEVVMSLLKMQSLGLVKITTGISDSADSFDVLPLLGALILFLKGRKV